MNSYTYTIFDGDAASSGACAWPNHDQKPIRARSIENATKRVRQIVRREALGCGEYRRGEKLWYTLWNDAGVIPAGGQGHVTL